MNKALRIEDHYSYYFDDLDRSAEPLWGMISCVFIMKRFYIK